MRNRERTLMILTMGVEARGNRMIWFRAEAAPEGYDECIGCGARFNATRRQRSPICKACR